MQHEINDRCAICGKPIAKCTNTCSCLPCKNKNHDCDSCYNDVFYCVACSIKFDRDKEMEEILLERRREKIEEVAEIEKILQMFSYEKDLMFQ